MTGLERRFALAEVLNEAFADAQTVLVHGYRGRRTNPRLSEWRQFSGKDWIVISYRGNIEYLRSKRLSTSSPDNVDLSPGQQVTMTVGETNLVREEDQLTFLLASPFRDEGNELVATRARLHQLAGSLRAVCGDGLLNEQSFENIHVIATRAVSVSAIIEVFVPAGDIGDYDEKSIGTHNKVDLSIAGLPENERRAAKLSLRLFDRSYWTDLDADRFLFRYLALDALAKSSGINDSVRAAKTWLAAGYGMTEDEAKRAFQLGHLMDLRSKIAHGVTDEVSPAASALMLGVYRDCLYQRLGFAIPRAAIGIAHSKNKVTTFARMEGL